MAKEKLRQVPVTGPHVTVYHKDLGEVRLDVVIQLLNQDANNELARRIAERTQGQGPSPVVGERALVKRPENRPLSDHEATQRTADWIMEGDEKGNYVPVGVLAQYLNDTDAKKLLDSAKHGKQLDRELVRQAVAKLWHTERDKRGEHKPVTVREGR